MRRPFDRQSPIPRSWVGGETSPRRPGPCMELHPCPWSRPGGHVPGGGTVTHRVVCSLGVDFIRRYVLFPGPGPRSPQRSASSPACILSHTLSTPFHGVDGPVATHEGSSARRSVSRVLSRPRAERRGDGHPSGAAGRPTAHAADPRAGQRASPPRSRPGGLRPPIWPCSGWSLPRFTPADRSRSAASSLWHWSSPHGGRALPATLRWGARTFLTPRGSPAGTRDHPTASLTGRFYAQAAETGEARRRLAIEPVCRTARRSVPSSRRSDRSCDVDHRDHATVSAPGPRPGRAPMAEPLPPVRSVRPRAGTGPTTSGSPEPGTVRRSVLPEELARSVDHADERRASRDRGRASRRRAPADTRRRPARRVGRRTHRGRPAGRPVDRLVGERVGDRVLGPWHVRRGPALEAREHLAAGRPERDQLGVLDPPPAGELLDDQLRVEQQVDLAAPSSRASSSARTTPVYSATLLVWTPRYSEIEASGGARGSRASGRPRSYSAAPSEAGPGLPRAAPSVRMTKPRRPSRLGPVPRSDRPAPGTACSVNRRLVGRAIGCPGGPAARRATSDPALAAAELAARPTGAGRSTRRRRAP